MLYDKQTNKCDLELFPLILSSKNNSLNKIYKKKSISIITNLPYIFASIIFILIGIILKFNNNNNNNIEYKFVYDSFQKENIDNDITYNLNSNNCSIDILINNNIKGPFYIYYELNNFYQNHRRYVNSYSINQLKGEHLNYNQLKNDCYPLTRLNENLILNPCGLVANSFFNDVISLVSSPINGIYMDESGISLDSDYNNKFFQPIDFTYSKVNNTKLYSCNDILGNNEKYENCKTYYDIKEATSYYYWYPNDDNIEYLYEIYPEAITPIEGITNEHFIVWFKPAGLNHFRKLYGIIHNDLISGDRLKFNIELNYNITNFNGEKSFILTNLSNFGTKDASNTLGKKFIIVSLVLTTNINILH
jgi:hypothetical protein